MMAPDVASFLWNVVRLDRPNRKTLVQTNIDAPAEPHGEVRLRHASEQPRNTEEGVGVLGYSTFTKAEARPEEELVRAEVVKFHGGAENVLGPPELYRA